MISIDSLINVEKFIEIFSKSEYRKKLDSIILNFFGLENKSVINYCTLKNNDITLEFIIFINKKYVFNIIIKDTKYIFDTSKKFYLNFSFEINKKNYMLLYPCYWEFYCITCLKNKKRKKYIETFAAILASKKRKEIKLLLKRLKVFNKKEINGIMDMIEDNK